MGPERRSMVMSEKEKELTAWHEAGHAIVAMKVPSADPVHKATIIPRGRALGMVMQLPEDDKLSMSKVEMTSRLAIIMGGRVAEELKFGLDNVTAGAASDIQQATRLARAMVTRWGYSDIIGPVDYGSDQGDVFLGQQLMQSSHISEETSRKIEEEVRKLIEQGKEDARRVMTEPAPSGKRLRSACSSTKRCPATRSRRSSKARPRRVRTRPRTMPARRLRCRSSASANAPALIPRRTRPEANPTFPLKPGLIGWASCLSEPLSRPPSPS
jgi:ATP-dependent Zn protease